jgi:hypothetical protein
MVAPSSAGGGHLDVPMVSRVAHPPVNWTMVVQLASLSLVRALFLGAMIAGMVVPEKSWCLVECPACWEPQEEGMMNTAARFSLS